MRGEKRRGTRTEERLDKKFDDKLHAYERCDGLKKTEEPASASDVAIYRSTFLGSR